MNSKFPIIGWVLVLALVTSACSSEDGTVATTATESSIAESTEPATTESTEPTDTQSSEPTDSSGSDTDGATGTNTGVNERAVEAANALIAQLSPDEVETLSYEFGDGAITSSWSNLPACDTNGRAGIRHGDLNSDQVAAVMDVVKSVLSDEGYTEYAQIIAADEELGGGDGDVWDADCYYMAFFGEPSTSSSWAMQFGGHHYARTITLENGSVSVTPAFTGVEPRTFTLDGETVAPLGDEAEATFALFGALDDDQFAAAELSGRIQEVLLGPREDDAFPAQEGLLLSEASDEVKQLAMAAIENWVNDFDTETAASILAQIESELDETYIGWANSIDIDTQDAYGRIDGPSVWIEFINEGGVGGNDIHQHSVYRDKTNDYGSAA